MVKNPHQSMPISGAMLVSGRVRVKILKKMKPPPTLPETNIAPENRPLEKEIPIGNYDFQGLC